MTCRQPKNDKRLINVFQQASTSLPQKCWRKTTKRNGYQRQYSPPVEVEFVKDLIVFIDVVSIVTQCIGHCILTSGVVPGTERCLIVPAGINVLNIHIQQCGRRFLLIHKLRAQGSSILKVQVQVIDIKRQTRSGCYTTSNQHQQQKLFKPGKRRVR